MSKIEVTKRINFVMGHRVHNQNLPCTLGPNKCRHLHGHEYVLELFLTKQMDNDDCMVLDFTFFNYLNDFVQKYLDHRFMIDINDPLFEEITGVSKNSDNKLEFYFIGSNNHLVEKDTNRTFRGYYSLLRSNDKKMPDFIMFQSESEHKSSFVIVNFVPTAENLCKFFKDVYDKLSSNTGVYPSDVKVSKIRLYETQKAYCELHF